MIKNAIANMAGKTVAVNTDPGEDTGLVVATRPHKTFVPRTVFFSNETYGREMAQDGAFGGAGLLVHDGTDNADWSSFSQVGTAKWTEDSTDRFFDGSKSIKSDNAAVGSYAQFINSTGPGTDVDISSYVAITMWINVDKDWAAGDSVIIYAFLNGVLEGNLVALEDYFDFSMHDQWHFINIPLADMGLSSSSIDALRISQAAKECGKSPTFYIDLLRIEKTGAPIIFTVKPNISCWYHIKSYQTLFADVVTADNADSTMLQLSYNKILDMTPTEGYVYSRYRHGKLIPGTSWQITNLADFLSIPNSTITNAVSDGTNTMITISGEQPDNLILKSEFEDEIRITIRDDFSALLLFRASIMGYEETRQDRR